ncbi:hypothetical protein QF030_000318 [Streptomyces rishiriensis]|uniref:Uncharacterized protein n=1 Tax=Streptomyces rishiriensis TaxID=68264 RepID=A0ABU0NHU1_STRRH|nr:hypothetical protein [Streptomyces rishiriensis]
MHRRVLGLPVLGLVQMSSRGRRSPGLPSPRRAEVPLKPQGRTLCRSRVRTARSWGAGGDVRRAGCEVGLACGDAGPDAGADGRAPAVVAHRAPTAGRWRGRPGSGSTSGASSCRPTSSSQPTGAGASSRSGPPCLWSPGSPNAERTSTCRRLRAPEGHGDPRRRHWRPRRRAAAATWVSGSGVAWACMHRPAQSSIRARYTDDVLRACREYVGAESEQSARTWTGPASSSWPKRTSAASAAYRTP